MHYQYRCYWVIGNVVYVWVMPRGTPWSTVWQFLDKRMQDPKCMLAWAQAVPCVPMRVVS